MKLASWLSNFTLPTSGSGHSQRSRRQTSAWSPATVAERLESRALLSVGAIPVGTESRVNSYTTGNQIAPQVAMDSAGDYAVAWIDKTRNYGIYAQRFNAVGVAQGSEFQVNTITIDQTQGFQLSMDAAGDFFVAYNQKITEDIYIHHYNAAGVPQGAEFKVNSSSVVAGFQIATDAAGDFVVTYMPYLDGPVKARSYNKSAVAQEAEFTVSPYTQQVISWSVSMDAAGDFIVATVPEPILSQTAEAQRYNLAGVSQGLPIALGSLEVAGATVTMDSAGDFIAVIQYFQIAGGGSEVDLYNSNGVFQRTIPTPVDTGNSISSSTVHFDPSGDFSLTTFNSGGYGNHAYTQRYNAAGLPLGTLLPVVPDIYTDAAGNFIKLSTTTVGAGSQVSVQSYAYNGTRVGNPVHVNTITTGGPASVVIATNATGAFVAVWVNSSQDGSGSGIYIQRFTTQGSIATDVRQGTGPRVVNSLDRLTTAVSQLSVDFSDNQNSSSGNPNSVINPSNWRLFRFGIDVSYLISNITFGLDATTGVYAAVVTFVNPLPNGSYLLVARQTIRNLSSQLLDGEADAISGGDFHRNFAVASTLPIGVETRVNATTTNNQQNPAIATDATGDYVVAWQSAQDGSGYGIYARRYNSAGVAQGTEFRVNSYTTGNQTAPRVAMDAAGNFVVVWQSQGQDEGGYGVYAQQFNATGVALRGEFLVNSYTTDNQKSPAVAMDATGNFVVAWESFGQQSTGYDIYQERYNSAGTPQLGESAVSAGHNETAPAVAMDAAGDVVITWQSGGTVVAVQYPASEGATPSDFVVNTYTTGIQGAPSVAIDSSGDFVIVWDSANQDGSGYGVYGQRFNSRAITLGGEFRANTSTSGSQTTPVVSMDNSGDYVVAWASYGQDGNKYGVYAQRFQSTGVLAGSEFRVNAYTSLNQESPSVAMDASGDFVFAWQSANQDGNGYGVYAQGYQANVVPWIYGIETTTLSAAASLQTPVTTSLQIFDANSTTWSSATIQISVNYRNDQDVLAFNNASTPKIMGAWNASTGTLTLSGIDTISDYRTALHNVTFHNTSLSPTTSLYRIVDITVNDGSLTSGVVSRTVQVTGTTTPAVLSNVSGSVTYIDSSAAIAVAGGLIITDPTATVLASATVSFTNWQAEDRLNFNNLFALQHTFTQNLINHTAMLTITGSQTVDHYQATLRSVLYSDVSANPLTTVRTANFQVSDGNSSSNIVSRAVNVIAVNNPPTLSAIETTALAYKANDPAFPPQPISATLLLADADSANLTKAVIQISVGYQNNSGGKDVLTFANMFGITGSFDASSGTMTLTGTSSGSNYRTAIRSVKFSTSGTAVSTANRTISISISDNGMPVAISAATSRTVTVLTTNIPPSLAGIPTIPLAYARGTSAVAVLPGVFVVDPDSINMTQAVIQVTANYQKGQDILGFTMRFGVTGSFDATSGKLTLTGTTTLSNYQTLLRSVTFKTNTSAASSLTRTITFTIKDGIDSCYPITRSVTLS